MYTQASLGAILRHCCRLAPVRQDQPDGEGAEHAGTTGGNRRGRRQRTRASGRAPASYRANRSLDLNILPATVDYSVIFEEASALEMAFAIWANVISLDARGKVENGPEAIRRATQYIRSFVSPGYQVEPPLADWETELCV